MPDQRTIVADNLVKNLDRLLELLNYIEEIPSKYEEKHELVRDLRENAKEQITLANQTKEHGDLEIIKELCDRGTELENEGDEMSEKLWKIINKEAVEENLSKNKTETEKEMWDRCTEEKEEDE